MGVNFILLTVRLEPQIILRDSMLNCLTNLLQHGRDALLELFLLTWLWLCGPVDVEALVSGLGQGEVAPLLREHHSSVYIIHDILSSQQSHHGTQTH